MSVCQFVCLIFSPWLCILAPLIPFPSLFGSILKWVTHTRQQKFRASKFKARTRYKARNKQPQLGISMFIFGGTNTAFAHSLRSTHCIEYSIGIEHRRIWSEPERRRYYYWHEFRFSLALTLSIPIEYEKLIDVIRFDKDVSECLCLCECLRFSWCASE